MDEVARLNWLVPLLAFLLAAVFGAVAQRFNFCTMGAIRDVILMNDWHLASGVIALLAAAFGANLLLGQFHPGFILGVDEARAVISQPAAHTVWYLNFGGMVIAGLSFALAGGCPGRQIFLTGEGDGDAGVFVLGMLTAAAVSTRRGAGVQPRRAVDPATQADRFRNSRRVVVMMSLPGYFSAPPAVKSEEPPSFSKAATLASRRWNNQLSRLDLPTLERPAKATSAEWDFSSMPN